MKINMILPALGHSGGVQMALNYLEYFSKEKNDVVCYVPITGAYYGWKKILFPKAIYRFLNSEDLQGKWFDNHSEIKIVPYINNLFVRNADIVIATSWLTSYWVNHLNDDKGKKVYFIQDFETWGNEKENSKVKASYQLPYDLRVSVSTELHDRLMKETDASSSVICNGIPESYIIKAREYGSNNNDIVIGIPFREKRAVKQDIKNTSFGINSLLTFVKKHPNIKLKTFGFKKPKDFPKQIKFFENPSRKELNEWYDSVNLFYVPSIYEGWGLPAMEAMARGCVVLGSDTGCLKELGRHLKNCYKIQNMTDQEELFKGLEILCRSQNLRKNISKNAISTVKYYSFEKEANKFLELLNKL